MKYYNKYTGKKIMSMDSVTKNPSLYTIKMKKVCNIDEVIAKGLRRKK